MAENTNKRITRMLLSKSSRAQYVKVFAGLAACVVLAVVVVLHQIGIAMTHEERVLTCPVSGVVAHTHNADCYDADGNLVCTLPELELHTHTDDCYLEVRELTCGLEESKDHVHTDDCYTVTRVLTCGKEEVIQEHVHGPGCFTTITVNDDAISTTATDLNIVQTLTASDGNDYVISVLCPAEAEVPQNAELQVTEIAEGTPEYDAYYAQMEEGVEDSVTFARFFDITIVADGKEIQPRVPVTVKVELKLKEGEDTADSAKAVHFDGNDMEVIDADLNDNTVAFNADGFSVYGIAGTETIVTQIETTSGKTIKVTVEVAEKSDIERLESVRVKELSEKSDEYATAYNAVAADKEAKDANFNKDTLGLFAADIELLDANGNPFEPEGAVKVTMELISLPTDENTLVATMEVQHLVEQNGTIGVQTVASNSYVNKVDDVITTEFYVESFSTFALTWFDDSSNEVATNDSTAVLNIQSGTDTYITIGVHYVDEQGNSINRPQESFSADSPVTIGGLLNGSIAGYEYKSSHYGTYSGKQIQQLNANRTATVTTTIEPIDLGGTDWYGKLQGYTTKPPYDEFFSNDQLTESITWNNRNNKFYKGASVYRNGKVYARNIKTTTNYSYTLSFDNAEIATLTHENYSGAWSNAADIYIVYKSTDTNLKQATVHYGTLNADGSFTELQESTNLDISAASVSLNATISGYEYAGAYYSDSATGTPAANTVPINSILRKNDDKWQYVNAAGGTGVVNNNSHIYVTYTENANQGASATPTPANSTDIPAPTTIKKVTHHKDENGQDNGTYDVQIDIIGKQIVHEERKGANVLLIFDRTSSMSGSMTGAPGNGQRIDAAKAAVHTLVNALDPATNPVELAVFSFDRFANEPYTKNGSYWTNDGAAITSHTDNLTLALSGSAGGKNGGTNWEAAFKKASAVLETADSDPTYVIFLTDGNPTIHEGTANNNNGINSNPTETSDEYTRARTEANKLNSKYKIYGVLCANQSDGPLLQTLVTYLNNNNHTASHILANDATTLKNTFKDIADYIVSQLGANNVSTNDGITALSSVNASVSGAAGAFKYYKAYEVTHNNNKYTYVGDDGQTHEVNEADVKTYTYKDEQGHDRTYLYYNRETWNEAPGASYSEQSGVTWDLSSEGILNEGEIYSVKFTIWPSQDAYDLLADLNNGIKVYDEGQPNSITAEERDQVYESGGIYYMKTNTNLDTTYSFNSQTYTDDIDYHQGAMDLRVEKISLRKNWPANHLDEYGAATYRDENGNEATATSIKLTVTKDSEKYLDVNVLAENDWKADNIYISCGFMTIEEVNGEKVVTIKEPGHDYSVIEPEAFSYYWDLIADVYHPMVINHDSKATMLVLDPNATVADVNNETCFKINGKIYRKTDSSDNMLQASNYRRSNLNITKNVSTPNAPADAMFEYTVTVHDADSTDGKVWFSAWDPVAKSTVKDANWVISGAEREQKDSEYTGYWYATNGAEVKFKIKAGWNVRFLNLKHDSTFSIEESGIGEGYNYDSATVGTEYSIAKTGWYTINNEEYTVTGSIIEPNNAYTVTYTNKWDTIDVLLKKVDDKGNNLDGAKFSLERYDASNTWASVLPEIKPGDRESSTSNPVDLGGLGIGRYRFTEIKAPDGYTFLNNHVYFEVYKEDSKLKARLTNENGEANNTSTEHAVITSTESGNTTTYTIAVSNVPGKALPATGGHGTLLYTLGGAALVCVAAVMYGLKVGLRERRSS